MNVGVDLRRARRRAGLSQRALAELTGVAQPTIARIEQGHQDPRIGTLDLLLRACHHRLDVRPAGGEGVDRSMIRYLLTLTPLERADLATTEGRALEAVPIGALARRRSGAQP